MKNQMRDIISLVSDPPTQGRNYILAIAIDDYQVLLHNPVADVTAIIGALTRRFTFEDSEETVKLLKNERATKMEVQKVFRRFRPDPESGRIGLTDKDTLIVIFSGHGDYDAEEDSGWWIPFDGVKEEGERVNFISDYEISGWLNAIPAGQIILIVDACFGGRMLTTEGGLGFRRKNHLLAPYLLTSGGVEKVKDGKPGEHSPFAKLLLQALYEHPAGALSLADLGKKIALGMCVDGSQRPWHGWLKGCGEALGEIALHLRPDAQLVFNEAFLLDIPVETTSAHVRENSSRYYQRLRNGRFKLLHISDMILTAGSRRFFDSTVRLDHDTETKSAQLPEMLRQLHQPRIRHILLMGDGGMGKTVASVHLWEQYLNDNSAPIPLFISLNEYNAVAPGDERTFLRDSLFRHYLDTRQPTHTEERAFWNLLEAPKPNGTPTALLMLDGLNEVTREKGWLEIEIRDFLERCQGVQVLITTRYDLRNFTFLQSFEKTDLLPLSITQIDSYIRQEGKLLPLQGANDGLWKLLGNPMMLTLYAATGEWAGKCRGDERFDFKEKSETTGELLWNFTEAQFAKLLEQIPAIAPDVFIERCDFFLHFLVPWIGFQMELRGQFILPHGEVENPDFNLEKFIREGFVYFDNRDFFKTFPRFRAGKKEKALMMLKNPSWELEMDRFDLVKTWLCEHLRLFVQEEGSLRFAHQSFRDFFAACHLLNEIRMSPGKLVPTSWRERFFFLHLRKMLGEIQGEQHFDAQKILQNGKPDFALSGNLLHKVLDNCRNNFAGKVEGLEFATWNVITIWKELRHTLAGADLSYLDLRNFLFNGTSLVARFKDKFLSAKIDGSKLDGGQFMFKGHVEPITSICYSPDRKKILSCSWDNKIKEWALETGVCLQTLIGHSNWVYSITYSPSGDKILSGSVDGKIKEWNSKDGKLIRTYDIKGTVHSAVYSPDGEKILSSSRNLTEWSVKTGKLIKTYSGHTSSVFRAVYSRDGKKILSASADKTLILWSAETANPLMTFSGHKNDIKNVCFSHDGSKALSAALDGSIKEWCLTTGKCLQTLRGGERDFRNAVYSPDGKKILSTSRDQMAKEWSADNQSCYQSLRGHTGAIKNAIYSNDGQRILTASDDCTVKEWSVETGECLQTFFGSSPYGYHSDYSPCGKKILFYSGGKIEEWLLNPAICLNVRSLPSFSYGNISYNATGSKIIAESKNKISIWSAYSDSDKNILTKQVEDLLKTIFSTDGKSILLICKSQVIHWMIDEDLLIPLDNKITQKFITACYSPDGNNILVAKETKVIEEWSIKKNSRIKVFKEETSINNVIYHPNGKTFFCYSMNGNLSERSLETGYYLPTFKNEAPKKETGDWEKYSQYHPFRDLIIEDIIFSPDREKIMVHRGSRLTGEWSLSTGKRLPEVDISDIWKETGAASPYYAIQTIPGLLNKGDLFFLGEELFVHKGQKVNYKKEIGLLIQSIDFRYLHHASHFTDEEKKLLRRYGAIFTDKDERRWKKAVDDAYGDLDDHSPQL